MQVKGICKIYEKDINGRLNTKFTNEIKLNARNVLVDMLGQSQETLIADIHKIMYMELLDGSSTLLSWAAANSITGSTDSYVDLRSATQTVFGNNITVTVTPTYAATSVDNSSIKFTVVLNPGVFSGTQSLEEISIQSSTNTLGTGGMRQFSAIELTSPVTLNSTATYTIEYQYIFSA